MKNSDIQSKQNHTVGLLGKTQLCAGFRKKDATAYEKTINELEAASLLIRENKI